MDEISGNCSSPAADDADDPNDEQAESRSSLGSCRGAAAAVASQDSVVLVHPAGPEAEPAVGLTEVAGTRAGVLIAAATTMAELAVGAGDPQAGVVDAAPAFADVPRSAVDLEAGVSHARAIRRVTDEREGARGAHAGVARAGAVDADRAG